MELMQLKIEVKP